MIVFLVDCRNAVVWTQLRRTTTLNSWKYLLGLARRLLKNPRMPRCRQFSEDRKEPSAGRSRSATDKLGETARAENWRTPGGREFFGVSLGVAPQLQPL